MARMVNVIKRREADRRQHILELRRDYEKFCTTVLCESSVSTAQWHDADRSATFEQVLKEWNVSHTGHLDYDGLQIIILWTWSALSSMFVNELYERR